MSSWARAMSRVGDGPVARDDLDRPGLPTELEVHPQVPHGDRLALDRKSRMPDVTT